MLVGQEHMETMSQKRKAPGLCEKCYKRQALCICASTRKIENLIEVLILQHPQEKNEDLSTARLIETGLTNAKVKVGFSWPNFEKALGKKADPKQWLVFFLGSKTPPEWFARKEPIAYLTRGGGILEFSPTTRPKGILLLDGTWSQSKTIWWRNPWLLKLQRTVLLPKAKSRYGVLRKEPRRECLSTLETAAMALSHLEKNPQIETHLLQIFDHLLAKKKELSISPTL
jgi:DTW domain-containing protein YfiP